MELTTQQQIASRREQMNIVTVGHVDHGKSTVIGRLLADTGSLPEGKLEQVKAMCERNARPFEYAFLLDALKNEQAQGITIDTARSFFKTQKRNYIINDAPGHIEFLKNMITGAARAEAALLVIDAEEGIQENSKRHGYMLSMLGLKQISVLVNKMDLVGYSQERFESIVNDYTAFLNHLGVQVVSFIPIAAREGVNIVMPSRRETPWYEGYSVLQQIDAFEKPTPETAEPFRMPVQDIYKFTDAGDSRRIVAGTIETGTIKVGDNVHFHPSGKTSTVKSIEAFNAPQRSDIGAGWATGFTLTTQIYIKPGELMTKQGEPQPHVNNRFRCSLFWMGRPPMIKNKRYKMKIGAAAVGVEIANVLSVLDASELSSVENKQQIERHDVAECILETVRPVAFDRRGDIERTGRFVIVDDFEIAGAGVILEPVADDQSALKQAVQRRELTWEKGLVAPADRATRNKHDGKFILVHGRRGSGKRDVAKALERSLFDAGCATYYFGISNMFQDLDESERFRSLERDEHLNQLAQLARVMTDAGVLFITTVEDLDDFDLDRLKTLLAPQPLYVVNVGENPFSQFPVNLALPHQPPVTDAVKTIMGSLMEMKIVQDFSI